VRSCRPYKTVEGARRALDNGGRLFDLLSSRDDGVVSAGELKRASGALNKHIAFLYFDLVCSLLPRDELKNMVARFDDRLRADYREARPRWLSLRELWARPRPGTCVVLEGVVDEQPAGTGWGGDVGGPAWRTFFRLNDGDGDSVALVNAGTRGGRGIPVRLGGVVEKNKPGVAPPGPLVQAVYYVPLTVPASDGGARQSSVSAGGNPFAIPSSRSR
jgi:hypothetical protein